jgi:hypothetical protein
MPKLYDKEDLKKLKDSKPVPIIAHTHEVIVPVVYSGMVNRFLEKKGVHLPLTHHELADMKREAGTPGYAKGSKDLKKKKKKRKGTAKAKPNKVHVRATGLIPPPPSRTQLLYDQLRPDHYSMVRPLVQPGYVQPPQIPDYKKEADEHLKREQEAITRYRKEMEQKMKDQMKQLEFNESLWEEANRPLRRDDSQLPLRPAEVFGSPDGKKPGVIIEEEEEEKKHESVRQPEVPPPIMPQPETNPLKMNEAGLLEHMRKLISQGAFGIQKVGKEVTDDALAKSLDSVTDLPIIDRCLSLWRVSFGAKHRKADRLAMIVAYVKQHSQKWPPPPPPRPRPTVAPKPPITPPS